MIGGCNSQCTMRSPQLSNPKANVPRDTLIELPNILSEEEASNLVKAIDGQYHREWCPEGFDRRHRVQRYSSSLNSISSTTHGENDKVSMEEVFGWIFDRIVSQTTSSITLHRPIEVVATEHTPSSCHSTVKTFEQNEFCPCHHPTSSITSTENIPVLLPSCDCYIAQLTLMSNAVQSIEKPCQRQLEKWDLAEPADQHETQLLMEKNGVVIRRGDCLWNWRGCVSHICDEDAIPSSFGLCNEMEYCNLNDESKNNQGFVRPQKLVASNKRCIVITFFGIRPPPMSAASLVNVDDGSLRIPRQLNPTLPLSKLLTIIVTTSPIRSHPSTQMLERTFDTFHFAGDEFAYECAKVIVCDGCRVVAEKNSSSCSSSSSISDREEKKDDTNNQHHLHHHRKTTRKYSNIKQNLRNGIATVDQAKNYIEFKLRLRKLCDEAAASSTQSKNPFRNTCVVELEDRHGYGFALRHALHHSVNTPYVCVIQHDRTFMRPTPVTEVVSAMRNDPEQRIKYVGLTMRSNLMYYDIFGGKYGRRAVDEFKTMILRPKELCIGENAYGMDGSSARNMIGYDRRRQAVEALKETYRGSHQFITHNEWVQSSHPLQRDDGYHQLSLTPTLFWYDNTHIVQTSHYRDFIFNPHYKMVARGGFVEDKLSPCIIRSCERLGLRAGHSKFGCYLLDDHSGAVFTGHLDGGTYDINHQSLSNESAQSEEESKNK
jgi:hypothetical protein